MQFRSFHTLRPLSLLLKSRKAMTGHLLSTSSRSTLASVASTSHAERTAQEPRDKSLNQVVISRVSDVNNNIRILRLAIPAGRSIRFLPGQWLDVHVPGIKKPGGFTITSTPADARPSTHDVHVNKDYTSEGYLELAVQKSPQNPPAAWLWQPSEDILGQALEVRVGGSFVWPPPGIEINEIKQIVFVAGGVGINPLISMIGHLVRFEDQSYHIRFFYSVKGSTQPELRSILFLDRLAGLIDKLGAKGSLDLHLTGGQVQGSGVIEREHGSISYTGGRVTHQELLAALGPVEKRYQTLCYVCGVPTMTDEVVKTLQQAPGMDPDRVLCERWW